MERLTGVASTEILVGRGLPDPLLPPSQARHRVAILTQPAPTPVALDVARRLEGQGLQPEVIGLPDRDDAKTLEVARSVYEALARFGLSRVDTMVGVGGGSVTDLAGFVAGTWLRGVELVNLPTTLLGAVDASFGGKTGVNLAGKNLVGVIWHPSRVVIDLELLESLPAPLKRDGLAEGLKAGLVADPGLAELVAARGVDAPIEEVVVRAVTVKSRIVEADEREKGIRAFLNFGHTIGHAIEFASSLTHGEAVGLGMVAAAAISEKRLGFSEAALVRSAVEALGLPTELSGLDTARVMDLLSQDKKRDAEGLRMVLLRDLGDPALDHVDASDIEVGLASIGL